MLCSNCFEELNNETTCPRCGYDNTATGKYPLALVSNTILNGRYITGRILGQGGFGITYLAYDHTAKDKVAIKEYFPTELATRISGTCTVMPVSESAEEAYSSGHESFLNEAKTLAQFRESKNIVCVHRYFEENGTAYLVMEYVEGVGLDKYMAARGGRLAPEKANALLMPLMDALCLVHQKGVVHRDIAPDNILVTEDGTAKLIDFGAARYSTGEKSKSLDIILKHGFAPFEQYMRHSRQGPYTDVYALVSTYYYAVTGKIIPEATERVDNDTMADPASLCPQIWPELNTVLLKGLAIRSADRYQDMAEMKIAFDTAVKAEDDRKAAKRKAEEAKIAAEKAAEEKRLEKTKKKELRRETKEKKIVAEDTQKKVSSFKLSKKLITGIVAAILIVVLCVIISVKNNNSGTMQSIKLPPDTNVGDIITFGTYEQDNDISNGKENIEWIVLDKDGSNILVISKYALDCQQYNTFYTDVTWESCSLRKWLNGTFLNEALSSEETAMIATTTVTADKNPNYSTNAGNDTQDRVFLLSITEAEKYFTSNDDRMCVPTAYAIAQGAYTSDGYKKGGAATCWWWLRSPGDGSRIAADVYFGGSVNYYGSYVYGGSDCVRPALWINLDS